MTKHEICDRSDLLEGERLITQVDGISVGIINYDGDIYALKNECAHQGGPVCTGKVQGAVTGEHVGIGRRVKESYDEDTPAIACPWHGWEYDLETGKHLGDERFGIPTYEVAVEEETVFVHV